MAVGEVTARGRLWTALIETGSASVLDGAASLVAAGLTGFSLRTIDVSVPPGRRPPRPVGVTVHQLRDVGSVVDRAPPRPSVVAGLTDGRSATVAGARGRVPGTPGGLLPRVETARAAVRAALWARSDREAALVLAMVVQQRLVDPAALSAQWAVLRRGRRSRLLDVVVQDICKGAQALSELDFAAECRRRGLPRPSRQSVRRLPGRTAYLDVEFEQYGFAVEIDGAHHGGAERTTSDALRQSDVVIAGTQVLRIPVLGYRLRRDEFMDQVEQCLVARGWRRSVCLTERSSAR
ncbi:hypothetical protein PZ938_04560 [Luteipulveratus sp. YIM 133132]|uniref:hypothetical protein n=1 Tax=Luteipulveratus flavus TaxID=3031728 RepID=UPI0023B0CF1B|nr:hypothetical protein [Luteipulveratus sp. YIM 133132]MDE9364868.1 hypothetical protein [Luteipulveratus sp. YIM 133132]